MLEMFKNWVKAQIALRFGQLGEDLMSIAFDHILPLVLHAENNNPVSGDGAARKAAVVAAIESQINKPGGIEFPKWLPKSMQDWLLSFLIDAVVYGANSFFSQFAKK